MTDITSTSRNKIYAKRYMTQAAQNGFLSLYDCNDISTTHTPPRDPEPEPADKPVIDSVSRYVFLKEFTAKARSAIEPAMRDASRALQKLGNGSAILREMIDDGSHRAHISFVIFTETGKPAYDLARYPHIAFVASSHKNAVWVRKRVAGGDNKAGEYQVNEITGKLVEHHIREFVPEVMVREPTIGGI